MSTLISSSEIAALAGVAPSTVSNWRKRRDDFPGPAETTDRGRDLFDLKEIERWLKRHRKLAPDALQSRFVFSAFDILRGEHAMSDAAAIICTTLTQRARELTEQPLDDSLLAQHVAGTVDDRARRALRAAMRDLGGDDVAPVFERVLEYAERSALGVGGAEWASGAGMTLLIERLLRGQDGVSSVFDPACGHGGFLVAAASTAPRARLAGQDVNADAGRIAAQRLYVHGRPAEIRLADSLAADAFADQRFDAVVCDPPWGMRLRNVDETIGGIAAARTSHGELLWLRHALDHVTARGHAYVVLPLGPLFRGGAEAEIRRDLVRRGAVEAVIALPARFAPRTSMPSALWALRGSASADAASGPPPVLFADFSDISPSASDRLAEQVASLLVAWRTDGSVVDIEDGRASSVAAIDLLDRDVNLLPSRRIAHKVDDAAVAAYREQFTEQQARLTGLARSAAELPSIPDLDARDTPWILLTDLAETGKLSLTRGRPRSRHDEPASADSADVVRVIRARDVADGLESATREPLMMSKANTRPMLSVTEPGDVLVAAVGDRRIAATVDWEGGHLFGADVTAVRLTHGAMPPRVAARFLQAPRNAQALVGTGMPKIDARALALPAFSAEHAAKLDELLVALEAYEAAGRSILDNVAGLRRAVMETAAEVAQEDR